MPEKNGCTTKLVGSTSLPTLLEPASIIYHFCKESHGFTCEYCNPDGSLLPLFTCPSTLLQSYSECMSIYSANLKFFIVTGICDKLEEKSDTMCFYNDEHVDCDTPLIGGSKMYVLQAGHSYTAYCSNSVWHKSMHNIRSWKHYIDIEEFEG